MNRTDSDALVATLRPWICLLMRRESSCVLKDPVRTEFGVVFKFKVEYDNLLDDAALVKLREAIDLVYRLLALHTELAWMLHEADDHIAPMKGIVLGTPVLRVLCRDAPFEMHIAILVHELDDAAALKRELGEQFLVKLSQVPSSDPAYLAARMKLDAMLYTKNPKWVDTLVQNPIRVECLIKTTERLEMMKEPEAERFFQHLVDFMVVLDKYKAPSPERRRHLPVQFKIGSFCLAPTITTPRIVNHMVAIASMRRARLHCESVAINPRLIACSREELAIFVEALTTSVVEGGAMVELSPIIWSLVASNPMEEETDVSQLSRDLIAMIAQRETISSLSIGGLLDDSNTPQSRCVTYQALLDYVLVREPPFELRLEVGHVSALDPPVLAELVQRWRPNNPEAKLRLKRLVLEMDDTDNAFCNAVIAALDEVEEISILNNDLNAPAISRNQIACIFKKFDQLRRLSLDHIDLETMDVFMNEAPPTLESIVLCGLRLRDRPSLLEFVDSLGNPDVPLAKHLRHLTISDDWRRDVPMTSRVRLSKLEVEHFASTIRNNRILEILDMRLDELASLTNPDMGSPLDFAAHSVVPAALNVRRSSQERARRVAFLSVLHAMQDGSQANQWSVLDTFLVRQVFEFDNPSVQRSILVTA